MELYVTPEYVALEPGFAANWALRTGVRSYFPLIEYGEYLAVSIGTSHVLMNGRSHVAGEVGSYVLFGVLGIQLTVSPSAGPMSGIATLRLRYF
jgi:hypothetical protein